jgi:hypothetical protein
MPGKLAEDGLDPVMKGVVIVEDGGAVEQTDATDGASENSVVVRRGGQGADEREQRKAAFDLPLRRPVVEQPA